MLEKVRESLSVYLLEKKMITVLFWLNMVQFAVIVVLVVGIFSLFPLKEKVPFLVQFSNAAQNFVTVTQANKDMTNEEALRTGLVSSYVDMRETKNNIDDQRRYEAVRAQSAPTVWRDFEAIFKQKDGIYQKKEDYTREVRIVNVSFLPRTNIAQVDFQATVKRDGRILDVSNFRAVLYFQYTDKLKIKFDELTSNPIGFQVTNYSLSKIEAWTAGGEQQ